MRSFALAVTALLLLGSCTEPEPIEPKPIGPSMLDQSAAARCLPALARTRQAALPTFVDYWVSTLSTTPRRLATSSSMRDHPDGLQALHEAMSETSRQLAAGGRSKDSDWTPVQTVSVRPSIASRSRSRLTSAISPAKTGKVVQVDPLSSVEIERAPFASSSISQERSRDRGSRSRRRCLFAVLFSPAVLHRSMSVRRPWAPNGSNRARKARRVDSLERRRRVGVREQVQVRVRSGARR